MSFIYIHVHTRTYVRIAGPLVVLDSSMTTMSYLTQLSSIDTSGGAYVLNGKPYDVVVTGLYAFCDISMMCDRHDLRQRCSHGSGQLAAVSGECGRRHIRC